MMVISVISEVTCRDSFLRRTGLCSSMSRLQSMLVAVKHRPLSTMSTCQANVKLGLEDMILTWRTGGLEDRRTGGLEDRRTGGQEDWRTGGQED